MHGNRPSEVLVVADSPVRARAWRVALEAYGLRCTLAEGKQSAVELLAKRGFDAYVGHQPLQGTCVLPSLQVIVADDHDQRTQALSTEAIGIHWFPALPPAELARRITTLLSERKGVGSTRGTRRRPRRRVGPYTLLRPLDRGKAYGAHVARKEDGPGRRLLVFPEGLLVPPHRLDAWCGEEIPRLATLREWGKLQHRGGWIATDLPTGQTLQASVRQAGVMPTPLLLDVFTSILEALEGLHRSNRSHGCLSAARIVIDANGEPVLLDAGVGPLDPHGDEPSAQQVAAPERLAGGLPAPHSDLYSVGALIFFALTGQYHRGSGDTPLLSKSGGREGDEVPTLTGAQDWISEVLAALLKEDYRSRVGSASEALSLLEPLKTMADKGRGTVVGAATQIGSTGRKLTPEDLVTPAVPPGYVYDRHLGKGATGEVFAARHEVLDRVVAIKLLRPHVTKDPEMRQRFLREARILAKLDHPNITRVLDAGEHEGRMFLTMELVEGPTLAALLNREGRLEPARAVAAIAQVLRALQHTHELGILHRDIKPANLLQTDEGTLKVLDFGLARPEGTSKLTGDGIILGTPSYMAPEQCLGEPLDARTDLYAVGATLFTLLTRQSVFDGATSLEILEKTLQDPAPRLADRLPGIDPELDRVVARLLAKNPDRRFASAQETLAALGVKS